MNITPFVHEGLGNSSYLLDLPGGRAAVVDPDRSTGRYLAAAEARGLSITHAFETHLHADFISGAGELAATCGATILVAAAAEAGFRHLPVVHGQTIELDGLSVEVTGSAGHTPEHVSYVLRSPASPPALFSGGSLIVGGAARTDLIAPELTAGLSRSQFQSIHRAFAGLPDETLLLPTHGGGSFCSTGTGGERTSTLGRERATNPLLAMTDEDEFVRWFPGTFPSVPGYFFQLRPINQRGPRLRREISAPAPLEPAEFSAASATAVVVDVRPQAEFISGHVPGALNIAFRDAFATWLGWLVPLDTPLLFVLGDEPLEQVLAECLLVGHERFAGLLRGGMGGWRSAGQPVAAATLAGAGVARDASLAGAVPLDGREPDEFASGHIPGALHIPLGMLASRLTLLTPERPIVTYCGHGERAATALSLLQRAGFHELLNLDGGIDGWKEAGYPTIED